METVYAALILHKAGKQVNEDGIKSVLKAAGIAPDESKVKALVAALSEINIEEVLKQAASAPATAAAPAQAAGPQAPSKEEKKEAKKEEEALAGLSALFG